MRLCGVAMVRNAADVIEAFVRHNLSILDGLLVIEHGSIDETPGILSKLQAEGLALRVEQDTDPAFRQSEVMTTFARREFARDAADFVFALDADEFLKIRSRPVLEEVLAKVPHGLHAAVDWLTYVPEQFQPAAAAFGSAHLRWRLKTERQGVFKVIASRALMERPRDVIASGNHCIQDPAAPPDSQVHAIVHREVVAVAHCPVRSRAQLEGKIIVGYLAHLASRPRDQHLAEHWREIYAALRRGETLNEDRLRTIACNYGLPERLWEPASRIELVDDPVPLAGEQRYRVDAQPDPLRLLMHFTETLIAARQQSPTRVEL